MGIFDKFKKKIDQDDDDLDELDSDAGEDDEDDEDDEDAPSGSFGGGAMGRAMGLLTKVKQLSSSSGGENGGGIGALLGKVKGLSGRLRDTGDLDLDDDDYDVDDDNNSGNTSPQDLVALDASQGDADEERPIRRSGIAAKLDGDSGSGKPAKDEDEEEPIPVPVGLGGGVDFESLIEEELVINPTLRDLAESLDDVSAVELAADLRTFLAELQ